MFNPEKPPVVQGIGVVAFFFFILLVCEYGLFFKLDIIIEKKILSVKSNTVFTPSDFYLTSLVRDSHDYPGLTSRSLGLPNIRFLLSNWHLVLNHWIVRVDIQRLLSRSLCQHVMERKQKQIYLLFIWNSGCSNWLQKLLF